ncbi:hypothetical protein ASPZODRAFT_138068 [Penicilliopsis zonata CBS 506.65]|uniref:Dol-P-Man:Man(5)GlcNAc(2)-PP-Dol alpha-1,3-mannosyltransferase n=1 Tax=Penicilliopsis zonata CBS 506.65 TaxID=1073090 RepID=A0A1L9SV48_9EURO|nr:hypothetical protein ASPZODRAFT_138068 [Penicilliopsis zonata CBS 506.65]OJJ50943.1 hypothetical protein ASPZODRAFT_138068 [Penicilliopsis zonata CBS 506.65]
MGYTDLVFDLIRNPRHTVWIGALAVLADAALCALVIWKISYTEIDWETYMYQVSLYLSGERDYTRIEGPTGPLVYPAAHVYIYTLLSRLTDGGADILMGQVIFAALYLLTLIVVVACYHRAGAPPYLLPLLVLSKRLHSVFVLRLFNDGFAAAAMWAAIYLFQRRQWLPAVVLWSAGVGIKMTLVLLAPAIVIITILNFTLVESVLLGSVALLIQVLLAIPFLQENPAGYLSRAFELTRQFMFKWTVNWRFVGEETFLSREFSLALLAIHLSLLGLFVTRDWIAPSGMDPVQFVRQMMAGKRPRVALSSSFIMTVLLTSLVIGLLCARSLHYQFYAYLAWATPFLLWRAGFHPVLIYTVWAVQEWAWNTYPSTNASSAAVVLCLVIQSVGIFLRDEKTPRAAALE